MIIEIKIPSPGESITEATLARWLVDDNSYVEKNRDIAEIESEKATLPLIATESGIIKQLVQAGQTIAIGAVACTIDTSAAAPDKPIEKPKAEVQKPIEKLEIKEDSKPVQSQIYSEVKITPVAKEIMKEQNFSLEDIITGLKRIGKAEVELAISELKKTSTEIKENAEKSSPILNSRETISTKISSLRKKLAERLVAVKNETAMLTTFNEVDMSQVNLLRSKYQQEFIDKFGVKPGLMSFFIKAVCQGLKLYPSINSQLDSDEIIEPKFCDIGIAVQSPKGLLVPIIRNAESLSLAQIELKIKEYATKARDNKISIDEMKSGTFTITNGGTFGSLLSTPIINPPQSGILGMHNIVDRPVAVNGQVVIRPMMYIALSYDHRIIDGKSSVSFLVKVKELLETPMKLLFDGQNAEKILLEFKPKTNMKKLLTIFLFLSIFAACRNDNGGNKSISLFLENRNFDERKRK